MTPLQPQDLQEIALYAIKPFYDLTMKRRSTLASDLWWITADRLLKAHPSYQAAVNVIGDAHAALEDAANSFHGAQNAAQRAFEDIELPPVIPPEPIIDQAPPSPLFTTDDGFVTASRRLIDRKTLDFK
jgi:hypothetical protein